MIERDYENLSLSRQCTLLGLSRSALYYTPVGESAANLALMRRIDELYLQYPFYGARQMVRHLAREGVTVGRHRVRRLMRLLGLEAIYRKPRLSVANPEHRVYPYLLRGLTIDRANQVWCADITYIPVQGGFLYLVAIMDWASRRVLAWRVSNTLDTRFCVEALEEALEMYGNPEIFNTDEPVHQHRVHGAAGGGGDTLFDGRSRSLPGQCVHRAAVAVPEVRSGLPARVGGRLRGAAGDRRVDRVLQRGTTALGTRWPDAVRGLPGRRGARTGGGVTDMGSRWQLRVPRSEGERVCDPVRGVIHNMHRIALPLPRTPTPCYRHLFLTGRGGLTDNGIHLNLPPGLSNQPGPPQVPWYIIP